MAIKLLNSNVIKSREAGRRMRDEARILGMLSHRNIVAVLDLIRLGDRWAIIMDYVPGVDLEDALNACHQRQERLPVPAALEIGAAVCSAIDFANKATTGDGNALNIVHRDIKPSNVRLTLDGEVKVLDFGVARVDLDVREAQTRGSAWLGTEQYMAPERILCEWDGSQGDVYAVAATVFEMLNIEPLGRTPVLPERHAAMLDAQLPKIAAVVDGDLGEQIQDVLRAALNADYEARPTAVELGKQLRELSRRAEGETLVDYCHRYLPDVPEILGKTTQSADGILSEDLTQGPTSQARTIVPTIESNATMNLPVEEVEPEEPVAVEVAAPQPPNRSVAVGVVGLMVLFVVCAGGGWVLRSQLAAPSPSIQPLAVEPQPAAIPKPPPPEPAPLIVPDVAVPEPVDPTPVEPKPTPVAPVRPVAPKPVVVPVPSPKTPPDPVGEVVLVDRALVVVEGADGMQVKCGTYSRSGTNSIRLRKFPSGECTISATYQGATFQAVQRIERPSQINCTVTGDALTCG